MPGKDTKEDLQEGRRDSDPPRATIAIVGRPNVGKSTMFNRLVGKRLALVDDQPGVTRDRREGETVLAGRTVRIIDTAGLEEAPPESLAGRMRAQTERAADTADLVIFVFDVRAGITPADEYFANWLRKQGRPVVLVANKCEGRAAEAGLHEAYALGFGDPIPYSAEHGLGHGDLDAAIEEILPPRETLETELPTGEPAEGPLQMAIVGRPNVGKSTLVNALIGEQRMLTGPEAGITRDAIALDWHWKGRPIKLFDTAGQRRRGRIDNKVEKISLVDGERAVRFAQVVVLVLDGTLGLERQDLAIARHIVDEGRAMVIAVNKWDAIGDRQATLAAIRDRLGTSLAQLRAPRLVTISAEEGRGFGKLMEAVFAIHDVWGRRIPTSPLNRWLEDAVDAHPPPLVDGRRIKLRYMTQAKSRPPTFAFFGNRPEDLPDSYRRYLVNGLRDTFDLDGVPIRLIMRRGKNPYAD